jgi:hypothetical protein
VSQQLKLCINTSFPYLLLSRFCGLSDLCRLACSMEKVVTSSKPQRKDLGNRKVGRDQKGGDQQRIPSRSCCSFKCPFQTPGPFVLFLLFGAQSLKEYQHL